MQNIDACEWQPNNGRACTSTTSDQTAQKNLPLQDMGKLCSKFGEVRSISDITILSTDAGWTDGCLCDFELIFQCIRIALDRQKYVKIFVLWLYFQEDPRRLWDFLERIGAVTRPPDREWEREREKPP